MTSGDDVAACIHLLDEQSLCQHYNGNLAQKFKGLETVTLAAAI